MVVHSVKYWSHYTDADETRSVVQLPNNDYELSGRIYIGLL